MNQANIGAYIAKKRKEKNLTQEQLAEKLGVSNKTISKWENDSGNGAAVPGKAGIHRPRAGRKRIKGEKTHGQQSTGEHRGDAVCHCNDGFGKIYSVSGQKAGRGHHKAAGRERESLGDQGGGVLRHGLSGRVPQEHRQRREHAQPDPGLHCRCWPRTRPRQRTKCCAGKPLPCGNSWPRSAAVKAAARSGQSRLPPTKNRAEYYLI